MKIKVRKLFLYMDGVKERELPAGEYSVPEEVAEATARLAIQFGAAVLVRPAVTKVAPENKVVIAPENKEEAETEPDVAEKPETSVKRKYRPRKT